MPDHNQSYNFCHNLAVTYHVTNYKGGESVNPNETTAFSFSFSVIQVAQLSYNAMSYDKNCVNVYGRLY